MKKLLLQQWIESERDWGQSPDGISLHHGYDDLKEYVRVHWDGYPDGRAPDYYTAPNPYADPKWVDVTDELYEEVMRSKHGKRFYRTPEGIS